MKRSLSVIIAVAVSLLTATAQKNYQQGDPNNSNYDYLKEYAPLKEYVDLTKYPNFKLGGATIVSDYLNNSSMKGIINDNFEETVAGNAMKMSSCVNNSGAMNFTTVKNFINAAEKAGISVYGHTLAWHSQQPNGFLNGLIKDKPAIPFENPDTIVYSVISNKDFRTQQSVGWTADKSQYGFSLNFDSTNGLNIHTTKKVNSWEVQFIAADNLPVEAGKTYKVTFDIKGSKAGKLHTKFSDWGSGPGGDVSFTTEWKQVSLNYKLTVNGAFMLLQCGDFVGDIYIRSIKFEEPIGAKKINQANKFLCVDATARKSDAWDNQFWVLSSSSFASGASYEFTADIRADKPAKASTQIHTTPGNYVHWEAIGDVQFTTEWTTIKAKGTFSAAGSSIAFNLSELADANVYYFDNISLKVNGVEKVKNGNIEGTDLSSFKMKKYGNGVVAPSTATIPYQIELPKSTPLTPKEKLDTLTWAMDRWIKGMMEACGGKVKAWDVVNEAISGGGNDGSGNYTLQHSAGYNSGTWDVGGDAFYWQDHMGDLDYVRTAIRLARKYGPEDIKLFINDYNLESDWDGNKKLKSLINWIKKWEADGETYVDGIGTQMHISCYMNETTQTNKKNAIKNMFKLMAQSGKLVRVSEFDMGMVDANGKDVPTSQMTEAMHQRMADFYEWIIKTYLETIPAAQQWGITFWCPTDSPANSGWRANTPVGLWTNSTYYRKHAYAGVVRGLGGVVYDDIVMPETAPTANATKVAYNLNGTRVNLSSAPSGIYVVNGKKVIK